MKIRRRARVPMCQKIKEISTLQPADILDSYWDANAPFVDIQDILSKMGIPCIPIDFYPLEEELSLSHHNDILGLAASCGEDLIIFYSQTLDFCGQNYVLAHELGHCCLHLPVSAEFHVELKIANDVYSDSSASLFRLLRRRNFVDSKEFSLKETEADKFAEHLLLPDFLLHRYWQHHLPPTAQDLSNVLKVPTHFAQSKIDTYERYMLNNINARSVELQTLQCEPHMRDEILLFFNEAYDNAVQTGVLPTLKSYKSITTQKIPRLYRNTGIVTMFLCIVGFLLMFVDAVWPFFELNSSIYIIWCLCCLSLFITNKLALAEWKSRNE